MNKSEQKDKTVNDRSRLLKGITHQFAGNKLNYLMPILASFTVLKKDIKI